MSEAQWGPQDIWELHHRCGKLMDALLASNDILKRVYLDGAVDYKAIGLRITANEVALKGGACGMV